MNADLSYENKDHIHIFIWHKSTREVVDLFIEQLDEIMQTEGTITYLLIDFVESGLPPSRYTVQAVNNWRRQYLTDEEAFTAIVYKASSTTLMILRALVPIMTRQSHSTVHFFSQDERDNALAWLQEEKNKVNCSK